MPKCGYCQDFSGSVGEVLVHQRTCSTDRKWGHVVKLRESGKVRTARRVAKKLIGAVGPPMSEETKGMLRRRHAEKKAAGVVSPRSR